MIDDKFLPFYSNINRMIAFLKEYRFYIYIYTCMCEWKHKPQNYIQQPHDNY